MFVLVVVMWFSGGGPSPSLTMHDFKTREACERAGDELARNIKNDAADGINFHWYCTAK